MAGAFSPRQMLAVVAVGIAVTVAFVAAWIVYRDKDVSSNAQIVISGPIDDMDSEASFHPSALRVLLDANNTVTWVNRNAASITLRSTEGLFDTEMPAGGTFNFTFGRPGIYGYTAIESGKTATIVVSTLEAERNRLIPVSLSKGLDGGEDVYKEMAATIAVAVDPQDKVKEIRLNDTRTAAYVTEKGADIIIPKSMCDGCMQVDRYDAIRYRHDGGSLLGQQATSEDAERFTRQFLERIGYELDGTEWVDVVDFGSRIEVTFSQKAHKWIIPNHPINFNFYQDHVSINIPKWYNGIFSYDFGLSQYDAVPVAKEFMDSEVTETPTLQKYGYYNGNAGPNARVEIFDDKVVYVVGVGYRATIPKYMDEMDHCGSPAVEGFDVLVDASSGDPLGWRYGLCE